MRKAFNTIDIDLYSKILDTLGSTTLPTFLPVFNSTTIVFTDFIKRLNIKNGKELSVDNIYDALTVTFTSNDTLVKLACTELVSAYLHNKANVTTIILSTVISLSEFLEKTFGIQDEHTRTKLASLVLYFLSTYTRQLMH